MNLKSSIAPDALQQVLDSARNAGQKGQSQWHTPHEWGKALSLPLPDLRPVIVDLTCGNGALLHAAALRGSKLLGCEIQRFPVESRKSKDESQTEPSTLDPRPSVAIERITGDVTSVFPLLKQVKFDADLFVLNFPWDTHFYRSKLALLAESEEAAVQAAFAAHDGRTARDTIDSTVAGLCLALDLGTYYSEGFIICNEATVQRLILGPDAPHRALAQHLWAHLIVAGNICQPKANGPSGTDFQTGILYFANSHKDGAQTTETVATIEQARKVLLRWKRDRDELRHGSDMQTWVTGKCQNPVGKWAAVAEEHERLHDPTKQLYNVWLDPYSGTIRTALSLFDDSSRRVDVKLAEKLHELNGKRPRHLVIQRESRRALLEIVESRTSRAESQTKPSTLGPRPSTPPHPWRVDPALVVAVAKALQEFEAQRAPLKELNPIMRLAYLDEVDFIHCTADLGEANPLSTARGIIPMFRTGGRYAIRTTTVMIKRKGQKTNLHGEYDDVQWDGQELAIYITDETGTERLFMEGRLRHADVKVSVVAPGQAALFKRLGIEEVRQPCAIDFTLQELTAHFDIPQVPDVAARNPAGYQRNIAILKQIEQLVNAAS